MKNQKMDSRIYDPVSGKSIAIGRLIEKLGMEALARKYKVSKSTILKWKNGIHRPARQTLLRSAKQLLALTLMFGMMGCSAWFGEGIDQTQYYLQ